MEKPEFTKAELRQLRALVALAYERELSKALDELQEYFQRWRSKEINAFSVSEAIHQFHNGRARELWTVYSGGHPEIAVVVALTRGVLADSDVPELLRRKLPHVAV